MTAIRKDEKNCRMGKQSEDCTTTGESSST